MSSRAMRVPFESEGWVRHGPARICVPRAFHAALEEPEFSAEVSAAAAKPALAPTPAISVEAAPDEVRVILDEANPTSADLGKAVNRADSEERLVAIAKYVKGRSVYRKVRPLPLNWRQTLVRVGSEMPNFRHVIDALQAECVLTERDGGSPKLPPFILVGPPGIGKSVFCEAIAGMFETTYRRVQFGTEATAAGISGSSNYWGNTRPGLVFDLLVGGDLANPVILIDEIDKGPDPTEHPGPFASLYALWQEESARQFADACMPEIHLDASRIVWFATCNSLTTIPEPVLSRAHIVQIGSLTRKDSLQVVGRLYAEAVAALKLDFRPLGEALAETLARKSPRAIKRILRTAIGRALFEHRTHLVAADILDHPELPTGTQGDSHVQRP